MLSEFKCHQFVDLRVVAKLNFHEVTKVVHKIFIKYANFKVILVFYAVVNPTLKLNAGWTLFLKIKYKGRKKTSNKRKK